MRVLRRRIHPAGVRRPSTPTTSPPSSSIGRGSAGRGWPRWTTSWPP